MTDRKSRRRLEFESLEAKELLTGIGVAAHHAMLRHHAAHVGRLARGPAGNVALNLSGSVQGTYRSAPGGASFNGHGSVSPIGHARLQGKVILGTIASGGQLTFNFGRRGKLLAAITGQVAPFVYTYQVEGGTRTFVGDTGRGEAVVNILSSNAAQTRGRFALTLQAPPAT